MRAGQMVYQSELLTGFFAPKTFAGASQTAIGEQLRLNPVAI